MYTQGIYVCHITGTPVEWSGLRAGFGTFTSYPRRVTDAVSEGWISDPSVNCT